MIICSSVSFADWLNNELLMIKILRVNYDYVIVNKVSNITSL